MLRLMDTRTRAVETITPVSPGVLTVYACGPTIENHAHVGNLRTFLLTDLLTRTGSMLGLHVRLVQNLPHQEDALHRDLALLNVHPANTYPNASECIDLMLRVIERLLAQGHAYLDAGGTVSFSAESFPSYGAFSGNKLLPADWALWTSAPASGGRTWDSPWGPGTPGRDLACSAMSLDLLGTTIDVHVGGIDLLFPHHENVRAQSDCFAGKEVVRHWVHGEHLLFEGRPGNAVLLSEVVERGFDPLALRLALLSSRYRDQANLSWDSIASAQRTLSRWRALVAQGAESPSKPIDATVKADVLEAFSDDLDTPRALRILDAFESSGAAPGCLFETFAWADRLLGLDLVRDVGRT